MLQHLGPTSHPSCAEKERDVEERNAATRIGRFPCNLERVQEVVGLRCKDGVVYGVTILVVQGRIDSPLPISRWKRIHDRSSTILCWVGNVIPDQRRTRSKQKPKRPSLVGCFAILWPSCHLRDRDLG